MVYGCVAVIYDCKYTINIKTNKTLPPKIASSPKKNSVAKGIGRLSARPELPEGDGGGCGNI